MSYNIWAALRRAKWLVLQRVSRGLFCEPVNSHLWSLRQLMRNMSQSRGMPELH